MTLLDRFEFDQQDQPTADTLVSDCWHSTDLEGTERIWAGDCDVPWREVIHTSVRH